MQPLPSSELDYEVIVIGSGVAGIYQIKRLTDLGVAATVLEANPDLGGTWYNNRYPGARFDSESYTYGYSWSQEVLDEWDWTEEFSPQPETLKYLNFVADKFDLRQHMQFNSPVKSMRFDEQADCWHLVVGDDRNLTCRFVLMAVGLISVPTLPRIEGIASFQGLSFHPHDWPHDPPELAGKKMAVVGTGASGIQIIPEVAKEVEQLTVFQRRPNWAAPLNNSKISPVDMEKIRARYEEIFATCARTPGGFEHEPDRRGFYNVSEAERFELWDRLYDEPGFAIWLQNFVEIFLDEEANAEFSAYIANRIRQRVDDPALAEKLIPTDHGFGVQRLPMETGYFETYNRPNVTLVAGADEPIERITETGIETSAGRYDFDIIVFATGFDAFTGAYDRIHIEGTHGQTLKAKWGDGPVTYLGTLVHGFPNMMMIPGPQVAVTNFPRSVEIAIEWVTPLLEHAWEQGHTRIEATADAEQAWFEHVAEWYQPFLSRNSKSWITGYNSNIDGHEHGKIRYNVYNGGGPKFVARISEVAANGYTGLTLQ
jgi:cation diffusion facilitator CzcD-associated flavoprotein CzcO